jgi:hypothetical protein
MLLPLTQKPLPQVLSLSKNHWQNPGGKSLLMSGVLMGRLLRFVRPFLEDADFQNF